MGLFNSKANKISNKAVAFVDFENWYISLERNYHTRPDMKSWLNELQSRYSVREIFVFGDFSNSSLRAEIPRIREITNYIIETQNAASYVTKDYTDFIMLDHIYQKAFSDDDIKAFILFTADGHFSSAVSFLKNQCGKVVEVYGVKGCMSQQLKNTASICHEITADTDMVYEDQKYYDMIFENMLYFENNNKGETKHYPSYEGVVDSVISYHCVEREDVVRSIDFLIEKGYISNRAYTFNRRVQTGLEVNWELAQKEKVYSAKSEEKQESTVQTEQKPKYERYNRNYHVSKAEKAQPSGDKANNQPKQNGKTVSEVDSASRQDNNKPEQGTSNTKQSRQKKSEGSAQNQNSQSNKNQPTAQSQTKADSSATDNGTPKSDKSHKRYYKPKPKNNQGSDNNN